MGVNLQKGQRVDLTKSGETLSTIVVGLGWDPVKIKKGFFGIGSNDNIDCDASVLMLNSNGKLSSMDDVVFFGQLVSQCGSVHHSGDNLTGDGDGDDEQIVVDLNRVPDHIEKLVFTVTVCDCINKKHHFGLIQNAFIRIFNQKNNQELIKYNLTDNYSGKTALIAGEIYRHNGGWKFAAIGEGTMDNGIGDMSNRFF